MNLHCDMPDFPYPAPNQWPSGGQWPFDAPDPPPRITLAGSLDPTTGIFYRTPEHPRLRTAQACEKCRSRKAKVTSFFRRSSHRAQES
ncbi:hypothetical protein DFH06DRAFT_525306 [Mycena polygramma]|nr:hypothetical protein DFH06DRAFT_525306 [Mycena polygramma]